MIEGNNFNLKSFQDKVLTAIELISSSEEFELSKNLPYQPEQEIRAYSSGFKELKKEAEEIVERKDIRQLICPTLKSVTDDVNEIAKVTVPVLLGAVLGGTLAIPLNPILYGWIILIIARSSVATICADY